MAMVEERARRRRGKDSACLAEIQGAQTRTRQLISRAATIVRTRALSVNHKSTTENAFYRLHTPKGGDMILTEAKTSIVRYRSGQLWVEVA